VTDLKQGHVLRKLQRGLSATETWCEHWSIKINEVETQALYFSNKLRPPEAHLTLNGWNIPFVNHVKYLCVIFDKRFTWRPYIKMIKAKAFRTCIRIYSIFKSELINANIKLTLHKAPIRPVMTYVYSAWEFAAGFHLLKLQRLLNRVSAPLEIFLRAHRSAIWRRLPTIHIYMITVYDKILQATSRSHTIS
jgi:hypothetical protein